MLQENRINDFDLQLGKTVDLIVNSLSRNADANLYLQLLENCLISLLIKREEMILNQEIKDQAALTGLIEKYKDFKSLIWQRLLAADSSFEGVGFLYPGINRIVAIITHDCQLRCKYCSVSKIAATMTENVLDDSIELINQSRSNDLQFQFFGGEPLLRFDLVKKGIGKIQSLKKKVGIILTTNGLELDGEKIDYFIKNDVLVELSLDGTKHAQLKTRQSSAKIDYFSKLSENLKQIVSSRLDYYVIMVVMPAEVDKMIANFQFLYEQGIKKIQINYALGVFWPEDKIKSFFNNLKKIMNFLKGNDRQLFLMNFQTRTEPVVLNSEVTVDCNGDLYLETGICLEKDFNQLKEDFHLGKLEEVKDINLFSQNRFYNLYRLVKAYSNKNEKFRKIILNNYYLGQRLKTFLSSAHEANN